VASTLTYITKCTVPMERLRAEDVIHTCVSENGEKREREKRREKEREKRERKREKERKRERERERES
jgi:hypothetical protein